MGNFYFLEGQSFQGASSNPQSISQKAPISINAEEEFWKEIMESNSPQDFQDYLSTYPNGRFADLAKLKIRKLESK
ncbi:MAG TPA: hypothetical protein ENK84_12120, partial [Desulfobulbus sp.]|nr:hypothetical protein [Desulfobulbus sp.]